MTPLNFRFAWYDEKRTALHYSALNQWTWRDYHACVQISTFSLMNQPEKSVHSIIDFRTASRDKMPAGLHAHMRTFGKRASPALTGHAIVIGLPAQAKAQLMLESDGTFNATDGIVYFVEDDQTLQTRLATMPPHHE